MTWNKDSLLKQKVSRQSEIQYEKTSTLYSTDDTSFILCVGF